MPPSDHPDSAAEPTDLGEFERLSPRAAPAPALERAHPAEIGRYRILEVLGEGGMGTVYLGEQTEPIRRRVAIKLIRSSRADRQHTHRFEAERQALARMSHPAIAQVYEAGDTRDGQPFFAMEHVPGEPITEYCDRERLALDQRLDLLVAVCRGIHHAHQKGVLHRDIKPANILVATDEGRPVPKIIDFGVAKMLDPLGERAGDAPETVFGVVLGTPSYLSPEAIAATAAGESADPDTRSDVYALGILLFELLVGERPFGKAGDSLLSILREVSEGEVPAPSSRWRSLAAKERERHAAERSSTAAAVARELAGDLDWIVLKATARERELRYDSAAELAADIERHRRFEPVHAGRPGPLYVLGRFARRYRAAVAATAVVILALAGAVAARTVEARRANREAEAARRAQAETEKVVEFLVDLFEVNDPGTTRGNTITARELLDRGAAKIRGELGEQPVVQARLFDTVGRVYRQLDLLELAEPFLREALTIRERLLGPEHADVAATLDHLGDLRWLRGDYAEAEALLRRALAVREQALGPEHLSVADTLDNLGSVCEIQAKYADALPMFERALAIRERALGPQALPVAASLDDLAVLHLDRGESATAEPLFRRALAIREAAVGPDSPDVAVSLNGLGIALLELKKPAESERVHLRALAIREKVFGPETSGVAQSLNNLASVYVELARWAEGEAALARARAIWLKKLGPEHPRIGTADLNLADLYLRRGDPVLAEPLLSSTIALYERRLGPDHPRLAQALQSLADCLTALGRVDESRAPCRRALAIREKALGVDDPQTIATRAKCPS